MPRSPSHGQKRGYSQQLYPLLLASTRERHSRASQREIEAFRRKNPVRTGATKTHEADMQLKSHLATEIAKDRVFSS